MFLKYLEKFGDEFGSVCLIIYLRAELCTCFIITQRKNTMYAECQISAEIIKQKSKGSYFANCFV